MCLLNKMLLIAIACFTLVSFAFLVRLTYMLAQVHSRRNHPLSPRKGRQQVKLMIVMGSGGHTAEMFRLISSLDVKKYCPRVYVIADSDEGSREKVCGLEKGSSGRAAECAVVQVARSREVGQSWTSTLPAVTRALAASLSIVRTNKPDVLLCNGPGTCVPLCVAAFLASLLGFHRTTIVYVESICRVESLSLTGLLLYPFVDHFLVQWKHLEKKYPRAAFIGRF